MFSNDEFNKSFSRTRNTIARTHNTIAIAFAVNIALSAALIGGLVWVAWHFISKFW